MNQIIKDLEKRYTTKKFLPGKSINKKEIKTIKRALQLTPSSINSQPWKFIFIESENGKKRFLSTFENNYHFNRDNISDSSLIVLFCHNPKYSRDDYSKVIDKQIEDKRLSMNQRHEAFGAFHFAQINTDSNGFNEKWTKSQLYISLGNLLHTLARMGIDSTTMEGIDNEMIMNEFHNEIGKYRCELAMAIGFHSTEEDYNKELPKSRLSLESLITII